METKYEMIGKCLYFPNEKIVCVGDLHLGFEKMLHKSGVLFPMDQIKIVIGELEEIFKEILECRKNKIEKIVLLGDLQHMFKYDKDEKFDVFELFQFLRGYVDEENIIVIRGNHDKIDLGKEFVDYFVENEIIFMHGHKDFLESYNKKIKLIVMGHLHSSVVLEDNQEVKKEEYKCFLKGKWKGKKVVSLPSFLPFVEGGKIENYKEDMAMIPKKDLSNFEVFVVNENLDEEALGFGKLKDL